MQPTTQKQGTVRKGWTMAISAWRVFKLDKELTALPLIGMVVSIVALIPFVLFAIAHSSGGALFADNATFEINLGNWTWPFWVSLYFVTTLIGNFFGGAVIHGAMTRFRGGDPTVGSSISAVAHRFKPLVLFSLLMSTVGLILQVLADRVPFAGRIAIWLVDAAWNIANFFALPIIIMGTDNIQPLQATKQSVQLVKKVWGESVIAEAGIGVISFLIVVGYALLGSAVGVTAAATHALTGPVLIAFIALLVLGLFAIILVTSVLSGIVKAALYHYATTGEAPDTFNQELLRAAITPKKASKIFG